MSMLLISVYYSIDMEILNGRTSVILNILEGIRIVESFGSYITKNT